MKMSGNTVLITGATSGIGRAFAERFSVLGNRVIACGRRSERLDELSRSFASIVTCRCDVTQPKEREDLARWAVEKYSELNVLINNAGIQLTADLRHPVDPGEVTREVETNLIAPIHLASLFSEHLAKRPNAALVNISSGLAFTPIAFMPVYCATKAAIHSFTLSLRHQLRNSGILVFEIAPPGVDTELGHERRSDTSQSHGGMPVAEFIAAAMDALERDRLETAVGPAVNMYQQRDALFSRINSAG